MLARNSGCNSPRKQKNSSSARSMMRKMRRQSKRNATNTYAAHLPRWRRCLIAGGWPGNADFSVSASSRHGRLPLQYGTPSADSPVSRHGCQGLAAHSSLSRQAGLLSQYFSEAPLPGCSQSSGSLPPLSTPFRGSSPAATESALLPQTVWPSVHSIQETALPRALHP